MSAYLFDWVAGESLVQGGDLLGAVKPDFDRKKGADHSVQLVVRALNHFRLQDAFGGLVKQLVLDGVIGDSDRHQDNWGFVARKTGSAQSRYSLSLSPAFDNGSSLACEFSPDQIAAMLREPEWIGRYIDHGKAHIRWEEGGNLERVTHEELVRRLIAQWPELRRTVQSTLHFRFDRVEAAIRRVAALSRTCPGVELSTEREELLVRLVRERTLRMRRASEV